MTRPTRPQRAEAFNMREARTYFSRLVERVEAGEEIIISRAGRPVARLVPLDARRQARVPGRWRGRVRLAPDFDEANPTLQVAFEG